MKILTTSDVISLAEAVAQNIRKNHANRDFINVFAVPRGGVPAAYAISNFFDLTRFRIVDDPTRADIFVDDIIDSGTTAARYLTDYPGTHFYALVNKLGGEFKDAWVVFPWEGTATGSIEDNIVRILQYIGEDPTREGLRETPKRVAKAWLEWSRGYKLKPEDVLKTFTDGAKGVDEMVIVKNIPIYSHCEHHLAAIMGTASIAYIPEGKIVGLSKLARLADIFSRRLQVQERLTNQIADALDKHLQPKGVGVIIKARHMCMESRGVETHGDTITVTSALRGVLKSKPEARAEFLELTR